MASMMMIDQAELNAVMSMQDYSMLSDDFWMAIFVHLDARTLCSIAQVCYTFSVLAEDKMLWLSLLQQSRKKVILVPAEVPMNPKQFFLHRRDFETISEAIKNASSDKRDRIFVSPGIYKEALVLEKPVDIIGEGVPGAVVVEGSSANTVLSKTPAGLIANLALRQSGHWFCVDVEKGSLQIRGCDITNSSLSAIKVGKEGSPIISGNKIHDTNEAGVAVFGGSGIIESNEFFGNRYGSIEVVYSTANPIIKGNAIHHNKGYGIHIHTQAKPVIQNNHIHENESDGISCWGSADPYVTSNKIFGNKGDGIYIHEDGRGTFEQNDIFNQKLDGIRTSKSTPSVFNNMIHNNEGDGVRIVVNANPNVKGNMIYNNNRVGIHVYREGCGTCTDNQIYGNKNAGMQVYGGGSTTVVGNKIHHNKCTGVYVSDRAAVSMQNNEVSYNGDCGIEVVSGSCVAAFERNVVHHNKAAGVAVYQDTKSPLLERVNHIHSNGNTAPVSHDSMDVDSDACGGAHAHRLLRPVSSTSADIVLREGRAVYPRSGGRRDDTLEIVSFLAEKAIQNKLCTFMLTREYYHAQYWYECRTCSAPRQILGRPEVSVCEQCAKTCHAGHDLSPRKFGHFYCDCGQLDAPVCKCVPANSDN